MGQLAEWKCHKIVKAGKVLNIESGIGPTDNLVVVTVEDANGAPAKVTIERKAFARGAPCINHDYLVIYEDGYKSWSPAKAFEEGYTKI